MENNTNVLPEKIQKLKDSGHKVICYETDEKKFYLRKPTKTEIVIYQDDSVKGKGTAIGRSEKFLRKLFVGENAEEFVQYLDEKPLAIGNILESVLKDMGADENFTATEI